MYINLFEYKGRPCQWDNYIHESQPWIASFNIFKLWLEFVQYSDFDRFLIDLKMSLGSHSSSAAVVLADKQENL